MLQLSPDAAGYRASDLVRWHEREVPERSLHVWCLRQS